MSKHSVQPKAPRVRTQAGKYLPGVFIGSKFVKKAGMTMVYENYNTKGRTDKQQWA